MRRQPIILKTANIPLLNLRSEFEDYLNGLRSPSFRESLFDYSQHPLEVSSLLWHGSPNDLLTLMLQRSILGLESYVPAAVSYELAPLHEKSELVRAGIDNPYTLNRKLVVAIYEKLPALVAVENKLSAYNQDLFESLQQFYEDVRNPIFHGNQVSISAGCAEEVLRCFELLNEVYGWIDSWYRGFPTRYTGANPLW